MEQKKFEDLELRDDFMFGKVMRNKRLCKKMLETLLDIQIEDIHYPDTQKVIDITYQGKSVRLDVYVADDRNVIYNAEMQRKSDSDVILQLPKRSRYYQGMLDLNLIEKGASYTELNKSYVIFICTFDPFGKGRYCYTFQNMCLEDQNIPLVDEATKIFFNTKGNINEAPEALRNFLQYVETKQTEDTFTRELDCEVERSRRNIGWRREYMKELLIYHDMKEEGRKEGIIALIESFQEIGLEKNTAVSQVMRKFALTKDQAETYVQTYWKSNSSRQSDKNA